MSKFQPQLSYSANPKKPLVLEELHYPVFGSYKYDGIRTLVDQRGRLLTRKLKRIPNKAVQKIFGRPEFAGLDGELIVGNPTDEDCYHRTESKIMTADADAEGVMFYVFDCWLGPSVPYRKRMAGVLLSKLPKTIKVVEQKMLHNANDVREYEEHVVKLGYEGIMIRAIDAEYKFGRSTLKQGNLIKLKRFADDEAEIVSVYPRRKNNNPKEVDERGYAKRSSHKANKVDTAELGGFMVRDLKTKVISKCSTGVLKQAERVALWKIRAKLPGKIIKRRSQVVGVKDLPRFPRFIGFRSRLDF